MVSEPDKGIYDAMNKGVAHATGDIVCFLNADDQYAYRNVLSQVVLQMRDQNLDALMGDVGYFHAGNSSRMVRRYRSDRFRTDRLAWGWMPAHPALFLRKEVMQQVGRFKTDYRIAGDFEFIVRVFHGHALRYRHFPEVLVYMQTGGVSTGGWRAKILLNQEVMRACRENGLHTNILKILSKYPAKLLELFN
jgi:glycosyltransferase involved in cell wall biosynthesis